MKKYLVNVNGTQYEIGVEAIGEGDMPVKTAAAPAPAAAPVAETAAPAPAPAPAAAPAGGQAVNSPMPGTILSVNVQNGQQVAEGDVIMILEAMKMENEIMAPVSGTVTVAVTKGQTVETGVLLCTIA